MDRAREWLRLLFFFTGLAPVLPHVLTRHPDGISLANDSNEGSYHDQKEQNAIYADALYPHRRERPIADDRGGHRMAANDLEYARAAGDHASRRVETLITPVAGSQRSARAQPRIRRPCTRRAASSLCRTFQRTDAHIP